jgi:hypothetical protein
MTGHAADSLHFPFANCRVQLAFNPKNELILNLKAGVFFHLFFTPEPLETSAAESALWVLEVGDYFHASLRSLSCLLGSDEDLEKA